MPCPEFRCRINIVSPSGKFRLSKPTYAMGLVIFRHGPFHIKSWDPHRQPALLTTGAPRDDSMRKKSGKSQSYGTRWA